MKNNLSAILVSMTALAPPGAMADIPEPAGAVQNNSAPGDAQKMVRQLFELSRQVRVSLRDAITVAEKRHDGSRTVQASFDGSASPCYRVRTVRDDEIWENTVDAKTGRIRGVERVVSFQKLRSKDRTNIKALKHITQELSEAVLVAEGVVPGMAVGGCVVDDSVTLNFVVLIVNGDRLKHVMLEVNRHTAASRRPGF
jgi:Peptidase propeptide and YPEB domain